MDAIFATAAKLVLCTGVLLGVLLNHGDADTLRFFLYGLFVLAPRMAGPAFAATIAYDIALRCASYRSEPTYLVRQLLAVAGILTALTAMFFGNWIMVAGEQTPAERFDAEYGAWWLWAILAALFLPVLHPRREVATREPAADDLG